MQSRRDNRIERVKNCLIAFAGTVLLMLVLLAALQYAPFGGNTLACSDARIQYLDFFSYYKDVLEGRNSLLYSFSNGLGTNGIGLFSYYLASPLNFLVVLFDKTQMNSFLDLLVVLKLGLCAASFAYYVQVRFGDRLNRLMLLLLSVGYGLMQYTVSRGSNIMWLDGVIMLPWILLGAWKVVRGRSIAPLTIPVALSILFNWYTGGINCLFCILFFAFEYLLAEAEGQTIGPFSSVSEREGRGGLRGGAVRFISTVFRYGAAMAAGVCVSAALFLPSVSMLRKGKGAEFYPELYLRNVMNGSLLNTLSSYLLGELSTKDKAVLFCGSTALIGTFAFFLCRKIRIREKVLGGALLLASLLIYYWQPLFFAFSLFKRVDSYYFRYGYLGSFVLLFLAAWYMTTLFAPVKESGPDGVAEGERAGLTECLLPLLCAILFIVLSVTVCGHHLYHYYTVRETHLCMAGTGLLITGAALAHNRALPNGPRILCGALPAVLLICIAAVETGRSTQLLLEIYHSDDADKFARYAEEAQAQADALKAYDNTFYRVSQTTTRDMDTRGIGAAYNDALAYGYSGIGGYSSCPENDQLYLLDRLGYKEEGACINIVNTSFLPADAFLGVKYILTPEEIAGLVPVPEVAQGNGKLVYENPYVLPMAFVYDGAMLPSHSYHDPFTYAEEVYTALSGEEAALFTPLEWTRRYDRYSVTWTIEIPEGVKSVYGNLPWDDEEEGHGAVIRIGEKEIGYQKWLGPSVFYIPVEEGQRSVEIRMSGQSLLPIEEVQFYALDLERLDQLSRIIRGKAEAVSGLTIENGRIRCTARAEEGEYLYLSVSGTSGWTVRVNGEETGTEEFGYCMTVIPLQAGDNRIEMDFRVPYLRAGAAVTVFGLLFLALWEAGIRWKGKKR